MSDAKIVRDKAGREHVLLTLADFQALLDASGSAGGQPPELGPVVGRLRAFMNEEPSEDTVDLDEFLAEYDAVHGAG